MSWVYPKQSGKLKVKYTSFIEDQIEVKFLDIFVTSLTQDIPVALLADLSF